MESSKPVRQTVGQLDNARRLFQELEFDLIAFLDEVWKLSLQFGHCNKAAFHRLLINLNLPTLLQSLLAGSILTQMTLNKI